MWSRGPRGGSAVELLTGYSKQYSRVTNAVGPAIYPRREAPAYRNARPRHSLSKRLSVDTIDAIIEAYLVPHSAKTVAQQFGIAKQSVLKILRDNGVRIRPRGVRLDLGSPPATRRTGY